MKFYRKQPIEAEQFDGSDEMIEKYSMTPPMRLDPEYTIQTSDGHWVLEVGNWIINEADEIKVVADEEFKQQYAELPVIPYYVTEYINYMKSSYRDIWDAMHYPFRSDKIDKYMEDNSETFTRAWLDGYVVEEEK